MRFFALSLFATFLALPALASPITETTLTTKYKRQLGADVTVCAPVNIGATVQQRVCRNSAGTVVPTVIVIPIGSGITCRQEPVRVNLAVGSITALIGATANAAAVAQITAALPVGTTILSALTTDLGLQLGTNACIGTYPANSRPDGCGATCPFSCQAPYTQVCGRNCILPTDGCASGTPVASLKRRDQLALDPKAMCPGVLMACAIPGSKYFNGRNFECVDTTSDIESCGACASPLPGYPTGRDCTAITNALDVVCQSGACVINACANGYELDASKENCIPSNLDLGARRELTRRAAIAKRQASANRIRARK